jgi:hypothetical protein
MICSRFSSFSGARMPSLAVASAISLLLSCLLGT